VVIRDDANASDAREVKRAEYGALLTDAYDLDKPDAPPEELAYYLRHIRACGGPVVAELAQDAHVLVGSWAKVVARGAPA
jgi:hypothetical protein